MPTHLRQLAALAALCVGGVVLSKWRTYHPSSGGASGSIVHLGAHADAQPAVPNNHLAFARDCLGKIRKVAPPGHKCQSAKRAP